MSAKENTTKQTERITRKTTTLLRAFFMTFERFENDTVNGLTMNIPETSTSIVITQETEKNMYMRIFTIQNPS